MEILKFSHPALFTKCTPVTVFGEELAILIESMWESMTSSYGLGLAANQVGISRRIFIMKGPNEEKFVFINPEVLSHSQSVVRMKEGCLSAPGEFLFLDRFAWVEIKSLDQNGKEQKHVLKDIYAVCAQHEIDHLDGKSFLQSKSLLKSKRIELAKKWNIKK